jgi:hypothetical protein
VGRESAIIGDARERRETIRADHVGMVKFSTRDDPGYRKVLNAIEIALEESPRGKLSANQRTYKIVHNPLSGKYNYSLLCLEGTREAVERQNVGLFDSFLHYSDLDS